MHFLKNAKFMSNFLVFFIFLETPIDPPKMHLFDTNYQERKRLYMYYVLMYVPTNYQFLHIMYIHNFESLSSKNFIWDHLHIFVFLNIRNVIFCKKSIHQSPNACNTFHYIQYPSIMHIFLLKASFKL